MVALFNFRLKADYDDVVKKNQELENRILQLVINLFSSDVTEICFVLRNTMVWQN